MVTTLHLMALTCVCGALMGLPIAAAMAVSWRLGIRSPVHLILIGLCGFGAASYLTFWAYLVSPTVGRATGIALIVTSFGLLLIVLVGSRRRLWGSRLAMTLATPLLAVVVTSVAVEAVGFDHGLAKPLTAAGDWFAFPLPNDNQIPLIMADALQAPPRPLPRPLYGDWLSSDRPPLQSGSYLLETSINPGNDATGETYEVTGVLVQSLWILGMWPVLLAARLPRTLTILIVLACTGTGLVIVNSLYVWPKLIAAAFLLPVAAVWLVGERVENLGRASPWMGGFTGAAAGFAVLAHGSSVFGIIAIAVAAVVLRRKPSLSVVAAAIVALLALQGSWMVYQHFGDPPGDRLIKWQIAGVIPVDQRTPLQAIEDSYAKVGVGGAINEKVANLKLQVGDMPGEVRAWIRLVRSILPSTGAETVRIDSATELRRQTFFYLLPSSGLLGIVGLAACFGALRRRVRASRAGQFGAAALGCASIGVVLWCVGLFGPPAAIAVLHQGSYLIPLLFYAGCVAMSWAVSRLLALAAVALNTMLTVVMYAVMDGSAGIQPRVVGSMVLLAMFSAAALVGVLTLWARLSEPGVQPLPPTQA